MMKKIIVLLISLLTLIGLTNYVVACSPSDCDPPCSTGGVCTGTTPPDCYCDFGGGTTNPDGACSCINGNDPYICQSTAYDNCYICHDIAQTCDCELGPLSEKYYPGCNGDILQEYEAVDTGLVGCGNLVTTACSDCCLGSPGSSYCSGEGSTCSVDGECCGGSYCSFGEDDTKQTGEQGYCCLEGLFWDPTALGGQGACREGTTCSTQWTLSTQAGGSRWLPLPWEIWQGCCSIYQYGQTELYWDAIEIF